METLRDIIVSMCAVVAIALGVPLIGAALAVLDAAAFQENDDAE